MMVATAEGVFKPIVIGNLEQDFLLRLKDRGLNILGVEDLTEVSQQFTEFAGRTPTVALENMRDLQYNLRTLSGLIVGDLIDEPKEGELLQTEKPMWTTSYIVLGPKQQEVLRHYHQREVDIREIDADDTSVVREFKRMTGYSPELNARRRLAVLKETMTRVAGMILAKPDTEAVALRTPENAVPKNHRLITNALINIAREMTPGKKLTFEDGDQGDLLRVVDFEGIEHVLRVEGDDLVVEGGLGGDEFGDRLAQITLKLNQQERARRNRGKRGAGTLVRQPINLLVDKTEISPEDEQKAAEKVRRLQGRK